MQPGQGVLSSNGGGYLFGYSWGFSGFYGSSQYIGKMNNNNYVSGTTATSRDDDYWNYTAVGQVSPWYTGNSGGRPLIRRHFVLRRKLISNLINYELFADGVIAPAVALGGIGRVQSAGSFIPAHRTVGMGIFGRPTSLSTVAPDQTGAQSYATENYWASNVAVYNYTLSDAQILRHYQAGAGTLSSQNRVAGSTLLDGVATGGFPVFVHRRDTGALLGRTVSEAGGAFSCNVGSYAGLVYAVAFDTVSGLYFPAQVFDLITPST
jgi:hypothetical protein